MLRRPNILIVWYGFAFLFLLAGHAQAQLQKLPIQRQSTHTAKSSSAAGRTKSITPVSLPFWDDFSFAGGDTPTEALWVNSKSIWVNTGVPINSPTIYAATFDGLDSANMPYSAEILANGYRDSLTSVPILLDLPLAQRTQVVLSFYYQWQGNGEPPDDEDYFVLEFKDTAGVWVERFRAEVSDTLDKTKFYYAHIPVTGDEYFHDDFQFRFRAFGRLSGPYDTWNIDYVYLNHTRNFLTYNNFPDRALASELSSFFAEYRAIPLEHFYDNPDLDSVEFDVQNLKDAFANAVGYDASATFRNYYHDGADPEVSDHTEAWPTYTPSGDILLSRERDRVKMPILADVSDPLQFRPDADSITIYYKLHVLSNDEGDSVESSFDPIDLRINDTLSTIFKLHDFYAYDDGTAEYTINLVRPGNRALVEFEMVTEEKDLLVGFDIYLPDYGVIANQSMDFIIHHPDGDGPTENPRLSINNRTITRQGEGKFFKVRFDPPIEVQDRFYIGWVAPPVGSPKIGVDASNDTGFRIFTNNNGTWIRNEDDTHGSVMIRPYFGEGDPITGIPPQEKTYTLFPNPNKGEFYIKGDFKDLSILSSTGQSIDYQKYDEGDSKRISFHSAPGLYIVRIVQGTKITNEKIIVLH